MSVRGPKEVALVILREDLRLTIADARRAMTDEELTQEIESILREYFMARVYPRGRGVRACSYDIKVHDVGGLREWLRVDGVEIIAQALADGRA